MQYAHRWIYVISLMMSTLIIEYLYDFQPNIRILFDSQEKIAWLTKQRLLEKKSSEIIFSSEKNNLLPKIQHDQSLTLLSAVSSLAVLHGLTIQGIDFKTPWQFHTVSAPRLFLTTKGNFQQITSFIFTMLQSSSLYWINHFSLRIKKENLLVLEMDIILLCLKAEPSPSLMLLRKTANLLIHKRLNIESPFCLSSNNVWGKKNSGVNELTAFPLDQIMMTGYFKKKNQPYLALMMLPNGEIFMVTIGSVVGVEHAMVTTIEEDYIIVILNHRKIKIMKKQF